ncbi:hypothetical protein JMJ77_0008366 [Colletotrichum scovillei]|uniref:Uncharacterized protein n=1 Tax=Colletotrichum scovillei TaxID=1209932 RepID=A0A9P7ULM1_9PEZI|nr:hypothetical protein JMJ77_0008366 [Colletotrichum scovillei]KAG7075285.1 hypothetical protein JMJ76_0011745 [Colletotrichum scovillei]KAG7082312.1 hypothetical protein JMJ78_0004415 [Colletotrichum scovillei]
MSLLIVWTAILSFGFRDHNDDELRIMKVMRMGY